jgi:hypothetical protein
MTRRLAVCLMLLILPGAGVGARQAPVPAPRYRVVKVDGPATLRELRRLHGADGFTAISHLNRVDVPHIRDGALLDVPEVPSTLAALAPFPASLGTDSWLPPRLLVVSRRVQAFAAYEHGTLVRWGAVSTGRRETPTPAGLFATNWKAKLRRSSDNAEWLLPWYVNFINASGVSFHEFALPGYPASHACVRLMLDDAKWIHDWAESWVLGPLGQTVDVHGTPVLVFGDYAFDQPAPWTRLAEDPHSTTVALDELRGALAPHRLTIEARTARRAAWLASRVPPL